MFAYIYYLRVMIFDSNLFIKYKILQGDIIPTKKAPLNIEL